MLNVGRNPGGTNGEGRRGATGCHLGTNEAGSDDLHGDAGAAKGFAQTLGQAVDAGFSSVGPGGL